MNMSSPTPDDTAALRVLVHQGFHKTGTTTLQRTLAQNRNVLKDRVALLLPGDSMKAGFAARRFSVAPGRQTRRNFVIQLRKVLATVQPFDSRPLLISNEEFSGLIPGRKGIWAYDHTHVLSRLLEREIRGMTNRPVRITFLFTTRNAEDWIKSTYWQNLRSNRIVQDLAEYGRFLERGSDLDSVVARVRNAVSPDAEVMTLNVSHIANRLAPLQTALGTLGLTTEGLRPIGDQNVQPADVPELFLRLNRSDLSDEAVAAAKLAYFESQKAAPQGQRPAGRFSWLRRMGYRKD